MVVVVDVKVKVKVKVNVNFVVVVVVVDGWGSGPTAACIFRLKKRKATSKPTAEAHSSTAQCGGSTLSWLLSTWPTPWSAVSLVTPKTRFAKQRVSCHSRARCCMPLQRCLGVAVVVVVVV